MKRKSDFLVFLLPIVFYGCDNGDDSNSTPPGPNANFTIEGDTVTPATPTFMNLSENADTYQWDFGDGRSSVQATPSIDFSDYGEFLVTLIATQTSTGRTDTARQTLIISPGTAFIDTVWLQEIPFVDGEGAGWDLASGPDIFFDLFISGNLNSTSSVINDVAPQDLPLGWVYQTSHQITDWVATYSLNFYDSDNTGDDLMGTVTFSANELIFSNGFVQTMTITNTEQTIQVLLSMRWQ